MTEIIGIAGKRGTGKDTAGLHFVKKHGFRRAAFADSLKEVCAEAFDISEYSLHEREYKELRLVPPFTVNEIGAQSLVDALNEKRAAGDLPPLSEESAKLIFDGILGQTFKTPREILQFVGTDLVRKHLGDNYWVDIFHAKYKVYDKLVITDVRLPNERKYVKDRQGHLLRLRRSDEPEGNHVSENSFGKNREYKGVIMNEGTVEELHEELDEFYKCLTVKRKYRQGKKNSQKQSLWSRLKNFFSTKKKPKA